MMLNSGTRPPSGVKLSCMALTAPQLASVVTVAKSAEVGDAEAHFLAFHVAARLRRQSPRSPCRASPESDCRPAPPDSSEARPTKNMTRHGGENRPALPRVSDHLAEHIGQPGRDHEDHKHLQKVGERRGIFERMRGVGVEESAAVGAQHLDGFLRGHRPLRDHLLRAFQRRDCRVGMQVLDHALRAQNSSAPTQRDRQQHVHASRASYPPRSCRSSCFCCACETAHQRHRDRDAGRGGSEILNRQRGHLHEVTERRFAANKTANWCS